MPRSVSTIVGILEPAKAELGAPSHNRLHVVQYMSELAIIWNKGPVVLYGVFDQHIIPRSGRSNLGFYTRVEPHSYYS